MKKSTSDDDARKAKLAKLRDKQKQLDQWIESLILDLRSLREQQQGLASRAARLESGSVELDERGRAAETVQADLVRRVTNVESGVSRLHSTAHSLDERTLAAEERIARIEADQARRLAIEEAITQASEGEAVALGRIEELAGPGMSKALQNVVALRKETGGAAISPAPAPPTSGGDASSSVAQPATLDGESSARLEAVEMSTEVLFTRAVQADEGVRLLKTKFENLRTELATLRRDVSRPSVVSDSRATPQQAAVDLLQNRADRLEGAVRGLQDLGRDLEAAADALAGRAQRLEEDHRALVGRISALAPEASEGAESLIERLKRHELELRDLGSADAALVTESEKLRQRLGRLEEAYSAIERTRVDEARTAQVRDQNMSVQLEALQAADQALEERAREIEPVVDALTAGVDRIESDLEAITEKVNTLGEAGGTVKEALRRTAATHADLDRKLARTEQNLRRAVETSADLHSSVQTGYWAGGLIALMLGLGAAALYWQGLQQSHRLSALSDSGALMDSLRRDVKNQQGRLAGLEGQIASLGGIARRTEETAQAVANQSATIGQLETLLKGRTSQEPPSSLRDELARLHRRQSQSDVRLAELDADVGDVTKDLGRVQQTLGTLGVSLPAGDGDLLKWIRSRDPAYFTIQLAAHETLAPVNDLTEQYSFLQPLAYYRRESLDRSWYVLLYGDFTDLASAQKAVKALPEKLKVNGPWIRRFRSVQRDVTAPEASVP